MTDNNYSRCLLSGAFNIYITNARARSINIKRKAKSQKKGGSRKTGCRNKLHINLGVFWGALWARLIPQPPSDNCSHKHCALIGSPLCCALSASPRQRWSRGSSGSRRRARWITHSWPLTPARTNWSSVPGIVNQHFSSAFFFFLIPSGLFFLLLLLLFSSILLLSCLLFPSIWVRAVTDFSIDVFKTGRKMLWGLLSLSSPAKCVCVCVDVFVAIFIGLWH